MILIDLINEKATDCTLTNAVGRLLKVSLMIDDGLFMHHPAKIMFS